MSEMAQLSGLINAQQAAITTLRGNEKSDLQELNSENKNIYKAKGDKIITNFNNANDARKGADDARKSVIAAEFGAMEVRALSLINAEPGEIESSLAEAAAILSDENLELADAVVAARAATAASAAAARADFGFEYIGDLEILLGGIFDD